MVAGHDTAAGARLHDGPQPLAYLYAEWNPDMSDEPVDQGHYDPDSQTWVYPEGAITAGVATRTSTHDDHRAMWDRVTDDVCV
jgi:hypothetical protein